jgi:hypothetical protein
MGTESVPETLYLNQLTWLIAREDCIEQNIVAFSEIFSPKFRLASDLEQLSYYIFGKNM